MGSEKPAPEPATYLEIPRHTRLGWLVALLAVQCLYFPINRTMQGGIILDTPWDTYFGLEPIWVVPYLLALAWWLGCFLWAAWKLNSQQLKAFIMSFVTVMLISYAVYILFPTYVARPAVPGRDWASGIIRLLYQNDHVYNAFPSGHTYNTVLIALYWSRWYPRWRWLWLAITLTVLLSTLFTRQHNLPDLAGGIALAWLGYHWGLWWTSRSEDKRV
jgi:membrane-associated phospholipid phosphatase